MKTVSVLASPFRRNNPSLRRSTPPPGIKNRIKKQSEVDKRDNNMVVQAAAVANAAAAARIDLAKLCQKGWLQMEDEEDEHVYEDIDLPLPVRKQSPEVAKSIQNNPSLQKSCSDTELFHVSALHERHEIELSCDDDVTSASQRREPEHGFYRCHDNIEHIREKDIIPDLAPKLLREKRHLLREMSKELNDVLGDAKTSLKRRVSLDSGRGGSVLADDEDQASEADSLEDDATRSSTSLPSRASSMSSGIGSIRSSCSTLRDDKSSSDVTANSNSSATQPLHSTTSRETAGHPNTSSTRGSCSSRPPRRTTPETGSAQSRFQPKAKDSRQPQIEDHGDVRSPPPPPLPPRNSYHKKAATAAAGYRAAELRPVGLQQQPARVHPAVRKTASKEVAQSMEALQQISQDLLSLMKNQPTQPTPAPTPAARARTLPRPRLPSPTSVVTSYLPEVATRVDINDELDDLLVRSATLPCKRTLNFFDSSFMAEQKSKAAIDNNNTIGCVKVTPIDAAMPILFVDDNDENDATLSNRYRQSSVRFSEKQRRRSDIAPNKKSVTGSTPPVKSGVKRRRTLFSIASPFSTKNRSTFQRGSKVRKVSESNLVKDIRVVPDEEIVPAVLSVDEQKDFEEAVRDGLPVIPFSQTPKNGSRPAQVRQITSTTTNTSMAVRALATPMASRRIASNRLEDHLVFLPPRPLAEEGGYFSMKSPCIGKHCQSCTCKISPKLLLFAGDDSDYVQMEPRTPCV